MRRLVGIVVILVILAAIEAGGWFWLAGWVKSNIDPILAEAARRGIEVTCPTPSVVGFPFAVRVACGETTVAERSTGTKASLPAATGGASLFSPMTVELQLTAPFHVESPALQSPLDLQWTSGTVRVGMSTGGPRDFAFDTTDFRVAFSVPDFPDQTVAAAHANARLSPSTDGGSDVTVTFTDFALTNAGTRFPPVSGSAAAELSVPPRALAQGRAGIRLPVEARNIEVNVENGGARFMLEGDVGVGAGGVVDGTLVMRIAGADALSDFIAALPQQFQKIGNAVAAGLFAFGQPTTIDGKKGTEVRITIEGNRARIGPIEFDIPRVPL